MRYLAIATVLSLSLVGLALADRTDTTTSASARVSYFECEDVSGVFKCRVCGRASTLDGGKGHIEVECVNCQSATFGGLPAACLSAFRTANGL